MRVLAAAPLAVFGETIPPVEPLRAALITALVMAMVALAVWWREP